MCPQEIMSVRGTNQATDRHEGSQGSYTSKSDDLFTETYESLVCVKKLNFFVK